MLSHGDKASPREVKRPLQERRSLRRSMLEAPTLVDGKAPMPYRELGIAIYPFSPKSDRLADSNRHGDDPNHIQRPKIRPMDTQREHQTRSSIIEGPPARVQREYFINHPRESNDRINKDALMNAQLSNVNRTKVENVTQTSALQKAQAIACGTAEPERRPGLKHHMATPNLRTNEEVMRPAESWSMPHRSRPSKFGEIISFDPPPKAYQDGGQQRPLTPWPAHQKRKGPANPCMSNYDSMWDRVAARTAGQSGGGYPQHGNQSIELQHRNEIDGYRIGISELPGRFQTTTSQASNEIVNPKRKSKWWSCWK